jgi:hypothetical protein
MTNFDVGAGHGHSKRRVTVETPSKNMPLNVKIGDGYDHSELDASLRVRDSVTTPEPPQSPAHSSSPHEIGMDSPRTLFVRALLLIVAGIAIALTYSIIAYKLSVVLVPLVLILSLSGLYIFALFLVPASNSEGMRSFGDVFKTLIAAAFPGEKK